MPGKRVRSLQLASISPGLGGCRCAQERGLGRRNSGGRGSPAAITCSRPRGSTRRAASPAAAPDGPPPLKLSLRQRRRPAPRRPRPQATPTCAPRAPPLHPPRRRSLANGETSREEWAGPDLSHAPCFQYWRCAPPSCWLQWSSCALWQGRGAERSEVIGCLRGIPVGPQSPIGFCSAFAGLRATETPPPPPTTALSRSVFRSPPEGPGDQVGLEGFAHLWATLSLLSTGRGLSGCRQPGMLRAQTSRGGTAASRWGMGMAGPNQRAVAAVSSG